MFYRNAAFLVVSALFVSSAAAQDEIKRAIDRGAAHLKHSQQPDGSWDHHEKAGMTALAGLALLEAGVPRKDPAVQKAASFVRERVPEMTHTYSVALAYLFLDKLAWEADIPLLEGLALRLLMGQNDYGGWSYHCSLPREKEIQRLMGIAAENNRAPYTEQYPRVLSKTRALAPEIKSILDRMNKERKTTNNENQHLGDTSNTFFASLALGAAFDLNIPLDHAMAQVDRRFGLTINRGGWNYYPGRAPQPQAAVNVPVVVEGPQFNLNSDHPFGGLKTIFRTVILDAGRGGVDHTLTPPNYKFLSGYWATKNIIVKSASFGPHGVKAKDLVRYPHLRAQVEWVIVADIPVGKVNLPPQLLSPPKVAFTTLMLTGPPAEMTMIPSQGETGKLTPNPRPMGPTPTMTADGICCLALGIAANPKPPPFMAYNSDGVAQVRKNCIHLALQNIIVGEPQKDPKKVPKLKKDNTYYLLFSLNQAANLLGLKTIGGKDFRGWGTQLILANQKENGGWEGAFGAADTAFALLFLTKSNLVPSATELLKGQFRDPGPLQIVQKKDSPDPTKGKAAKDKTPAPKTIDPEVAEQMALEKLKAAKATLKDGKLELAKVRLVIIVDDYPMTRAAVEAGKLLVEVERELKQKQKSP